MRRLICREVDRFHHEQRRECAAELTPPHQQQGGTNATMLTPAIAANASMNVD